MEARLRECLLLSTAGHIWSVANAASSLTVLPAESSSISINLEGDHCGGDGSADNVSGASGVAKEIARGGGTERTLWDLRNPLGVPPAARARERELREAARIAAEEEAEEEGEGEAVLLAGGGQEDPLSKLLQERCVCVFRSRICIVNFLEKAVMLDAESAFM